jgi:hypothetical protein
VFHLAQIELNGIDQDLIGRGSVGIHIHLHCFSILARFAAVSKSQPKRA